jgi:hypothetical protein
MVEWLAFLLHIREFRISNVSSETGYPERVFMNFLSPRTYTKIVLQIVI